jgi:cyanophycinase-like exopeptidase
VAGLLALVGGDEFNPGNEEQDRMLAAAARPGTAFVVPTAAARQEPQRSVDHATAWFKQFGLQLQELPILKRKDAESASLAQRAREGGFFYLVGGDPGLVAQVLRGSAVWKAMFGAWLEGAALAGSSAGSMALCSQTLVRASWPNRFNRRAMDALGLIPKTVVLPHFETFGNKWIESAKTAVPRHTLVGIDERSAAVWSKDGWRAAGPGSVTVIKGPKTAHFPSGSEVLGLPAPVRMLPDL